MHLIRSCQVTICMAPTFCSRRPMSSFTCSNRLNKVFLALKVSHLSLLKVRLHFALAEKTEGVQSHEFATRTTGQRQVHHKRLSNVVQCLLALTKTRNKDACQCQGRAVSLVCRSLAGKSTTTTTEERLKKTAQPCGPESKLKTPESFSSLIYKSQFKKH